MLLSDKWLRLDWHKMILNPIYFKFDIYWNFRYRHILSLAPTIIHFTVMQYVFIIVYSMRLLADKENILGPQNS